MFKPGQVRAASREVAGVLRQPAATHHRRRAAKIESHRGDERPAALPQNHAHHGLFKSPSL